MFQAPLPFRFPAQYTYPMKMKNHVKWLAAALFAVFLGVSCASRPAYIPEDLTPMELIQRGQEAWARNRPALALQHYNTLIERFPHDIYFICAAEYEIAFIYYRRGNFAEARVKFNNLLARYDSPDAELLPPQFRVLSEIVLERITEAENRRRRF